MKKTDYRVGFRTRDPLGLCRTQSSSFGSRVEPLTPRLVSLLLVWNLSWFLLNLDNKLSVIQGLFIRDVYDVEVNYGNEIIFTCMFVIELYTNYFFVKHFLTNL